MVATEVAKCPENVIGEIALRVETASDSPKRNSRQFSIIDILPPKHQRKEDVNYSLLVRLQNLNPNFKKSNTSLATKPSLGVKNGSSKSSYKSNSTRKKRNGKLNEPHISSASERELRCIPLGIIDDFSALVQFHAAKALKARSQHEQKVKENSEINAKIKQVDNLIKTNKIQTYKSSGPKNSSNKSGKVSNKLKPMQFESLTSSSLNSSRHSKRSAKYSMNEYKCNLRSKYPPKNQKLNKNDCKKISRKLSPNKTATVVEKAKPTEAEVAGNNKLPTIVNNERLPQENKCFKDKANSTKQNQTPATTIVPVVFPRKCSKSDQVGSNAKYLRSIEEWAKPPIPVETADMERKKAIRKSASPISNRIASSKMHCIHSPSFIRDRMKTLLGIDGHSATISSQPPSDSNKDRQMQALQNIPKVTTKAVQNSPNKKVKHCEATGTYENDNSLQAESQSANTSNSISSGISKQRRIMKPSSRPDSPAKTSKIGKNMMNGSVKSNEVKKPSDNTPENVSKPASKVIRKKVNKASKEAKDAGSNQSGCSSGNFGKESCNHDTGNKTSKTKKNNETPEEKKEPSLLSDSKKSVNSVNSAAVANLIKKLTGGPCSQKPSCNSILRKQKNSLEVDEQNNQNDFTDTVSGNDGGKDKMYTPRFLSEYEISLLEKELQRRVPSTKVYESNGKSPNSDVIIISDGSMETEKTKEKKEDKVLNKCLGVILKTITSEELAQVLSNKGGKIKGKPRKNNLKRNTESS